MHINPSMVAVGGFHASLSSGDNQVIQAKLDRGITELTDAVTQM